MKWGDAACKRRKPAESLERLYRCNSLRVTVDDTDKHPLPEFDANGVARTLIRAYVRSSPLERLEALEAMQQLTESVSGRAKQVPKSD
jgi:hypothetical protein